MEEKSTSTFKFSLKFGIYTGVAAIVLGLVFYLIEIPRESPIQYAAYLVYLGGMLWGASTYKNEIGNGFMSYGKSFGVMYLVGIIAAVMASIYLFVFVKFIDPSFIAEAMDAQEQRFIDQGMSDAQIDSALEMTARFMNPVMMSIMALVWNAVVLAVISLIASIFVKKEEGL